MVGRVFLDLDGHHKWAFLNRGGTGWQDASLIGPDGKTRVGPWLLLNSHDEVRAILRWGNVSDEELAERESSIRRWGVSSAVLNLTERQLAELIERGRGWPWNGYELRLMKDAGKYPPQRLVVT